MSVVRKGETGGGFRGKPSAPHLQSAGRDNGGNQAAGVVEVDEAACG